MQCSGFLFILILSSILILTKVNDAKIMLDNEHRDELQEQAEMLLGKLSKRLIKRQTGKRRNQ